MGRSGAGKSTLLYQLGLLDHPNAGTLALDGVTTETLKSDDRTRFRLERLGYVFQDYALLPDLTALENVALPLLMQAFPREKAYAKAAQALERVGLGKRMHNLSNKLSGGEQQRVSIARSVAHDPKILFADEPTANLDSESSENVISIFKELHSQGQTIVMVTHESEYGKITDRTVRLADGVIVEDTMNNHATH
jgi:putative ABC transport system ATP-binding protein